VFIAGAVYALGGWFLFLALGATSFSTLLSAILAAPMIVTGWIAYRRNADGLWWIAPIVALVVTIAVVAAVAFFILSGSSDL
jgi:hypothetical protein